MASCLDDILPMDMTIMLSDIEILEAQLLEKENSNYPTNMSHSILQFFTTNVMSLSLNDMLPMVITIEDCDEKKDQKGSYRLIKKQISALIFPSLPTVMKKKINQTVVHL